MTHTIKARWIYIINNGPGGSDPSAMKRLDNRTVKTLEYLLPWMGNVMTEDLFPRFSDTEKCQIQERLNKLKTFIPSCGTLHNHVNWYLRPCSEAIQKLFKDSCKESQIRDRMRSIFTCNNNRLWIESSDGKWLGYTTTPEKKDKAFEILYRQMWLCTIRQLPVFIKGEEHPHYTRALNRLAYVVRRMGCLDETGRLDELNEQVFENSLSEPAKLAPTTGPRKPRRTRGPNASVTYKLKSSTEWLADGFPYLFLKEIYPNPRSPSQVPSNAYHSFTMLRDIYLAFFGDIDYQPWHEEPELIEAIGTQRQYRTEDSPYMQQGRTRYQAPTVSSVRESQSPSEHGGAYVSPGREPEVMETVGTTQQQTAYRGSPTVESVQEQSPSDDVGAFPSSPLTWPDGDINPSNSVPSSPETWLDAEVNPTDEDGPIPDSQQPGSEDTSETQKYMDQGIQTDSHQSGNEHTTPPSEAQEYVDQGIQTDSHQSDSEDTTISPSEAQQPLDEGIQIDEDCPMSDDHQPGNEDTTPSNKAQKPQSDGVQKDGDCPMLDAEEQPNNQNKNNTDISRKLRTEWISMTLTVNRLMQEMNNKLPQLKSMGGNLEEGIGLLRQWSEWCDGKETYLRDISKTYISEDARQRGRELVPDIAVLSDKAHEQQKNLEKMKTLIEDSHNKAIDCQDKTRKMVYLTTLESGQGPNKEFITGMPHLIELEHQMRLQLWWLSQCLEMLKSHVDTALEECVHLRGSFKATGDMLEEPARLEEKSILAHREAKEKLEELRDSLGITEDDSTWSPGQKQPGEEYRIRACQLYESIKAELAKTPKSAKEIRAISKKIANELEQVREWTRQSMGANSTVSNDSTSQYYETEKLFDEPLGFMAILDDQDRKLHNIEAAVEAVRKDTGFSGEADSIITELYTRLRNIEAAAEAVRKGARISGEADSIITELYIRCQAFQDHQNSHRTDLQLILGKLEIPEDILCSGDYMQKITGEIEGLQQVHRACNAMQSKIEGITTRTTENTSLVPATTSDLCSWLEKLTQSIYDTEEGRQIREAAVAAQKDELDKSKKELQAITNNLQDWCTQWDEELPKDTQRDTRINQLWDCVSHRVMLMQLQEKETRQNLQQALSKIDFYNSQPKQVELDPKDLTALTLSRRLEESTNKLTQYHHEMSQALSTALKDLQLSTVENLPQDQTGHHLAKVDELWNQGNFLEESKKQIDILYAETVARGDQIKAMNAEVSSTQDRLRQILLNVAPNCNAKLQNISSPDALAVCNDVQHSLGGLADVLCRMRGLLPSEQQDAQQDHCTTAIAVLKCLGTEVVNYREWLTSCLEQSAVWFNEGGSATPQGTISELQCIVQDRMQRVGQIMNLESGTFNILVEQLRTAPENIHIHQKLDTLNTLDNVAAAASGAIHVLLDQNRKVNECAGGIYKDISASLGVTEVPEKMLSKLAILASTLVPAAAKVLGALTMGNANLRYRAIKDYVEELSKATNMQDDLVAQQLQRWLQLQLDSYKQHVPETPSTTQEHEEISKATILGKREGEPVGLSQQPETKKRKCMQKDKKSQNGLIPLLLARKQRERDGAHKAPRTPRRYDPQPAPKGIQCQAEEQEVQQEAQEEAEQAAQKKLSLKDEPSIDFSHGLSSFSTDITGKDDCQGP